MLIYAVGRAVLLDYWSYSKKSYNPNTRHPITAAGLLACANDQGLQFQYGDILLIRTGWIDVYNQMSQEERVKLTEVPKYQHDFVGVDQEPEVADFLHDNYFSAVASDTPAFEVWPQKKEWNHHVNLLPLWGLPIGELWDLEKLSELCKKYKQYAFFFASTPNNIAGKRLLF
jgi:kynurenine formamidase